jgi:hypothetical protein
MRARSHRTHGRSHWRAGLPFVFHRRFLSCILLLVLALSPRSIAPAPTTLAAGTEILRNRDFETGSLSPWLKYPPTAPGIVGVENCCANRTPGGTWDSYMYPKSAEVFLYQDVSVVSGQIYHLEAWVSMRSSAMTAQLRWAYKNSAYPSGRAVQCGPDSHAPWPTWQKLECEFTVPSGVTYFNVQLRGAPAGSADWIVTDDWSLYLINNNFVGTELRIDQSAVYNAVNYTTWLYAGSLPSVDVPNSFTTAWFGVDLDNSPTSKRFTQLGIKTTARGPWWFVYSEAGISRCLRGTPSYGNLGCEGDLRDLLNTGQWRKFWLRREGDRWVASIYDQNGVLFNLAHILSTSTRIYRAYLATEEAFDPGRTTDPLIDADFTN